MLRHISLLFLPALIAAQDIDLVSTSVVTGQEIETRDIRQTDQALALIEGVNSLRGFPGRGGWSRTLILVDGQTRNYSYIGSFNWSTLPPSGIERAEGARGPFSDAGVA